MLWSRVDPVLHSISRLSCPPLQMLDEYEDEYDDSFDDLKMYGPGGAGDAETDFEDGSKAAEAGKGPGLGRGESTGGVRHAAVQSDRGSGPSRFSAQAKSFDSAAPGPGSGAAGPGSSGPSSSSAAPPSRGRGKGAGRPSVFVADGKIYQYDPKREGAVACTSMEEAEMVGSICLYMVRVDFVESSPHCRCSSGSRRSRSWAWARGATRPGLRGWRPRDPKAVPLRALPAVRQRETGSRETRQAQGCHTCCTGGADGRGRGRGSHAFKDKHKASIGNHHRKDRHTAKMSKGMF